MKTLQLASCATPAICLILAYLLLFEGAATSAIIFGLVILSLALSAILTCLGLILLLTSRQKKIPLAVATLAALIPGALLATAHLTGFGAGGIFDAVNHGNTWKVALVLEANPRFVSIKDNYGGTPLHRVLNKEVAQVLLTAGADVDAKDDRGLTPLDWAIQTGRNDVSELLVAHKANVKATDNRGWTPLHYAVISTGHKGKLQLVALLLAKGADVDARDSHGLTPLQWTGAPELAELLLKNGADINAKNNNGVSALHLAIGNRRHDLADFLLQHGGQDIAPASAAPPISQIAAMKGGLNDIKLLVATHPELVSTSDANGKTPLHWAAMLDHRDVAAFLLANKADVNARDHHQLTPLHYAFGKDVAELLLASGADVAAKDQDGRTPLHVAAGQVSSGMAEALLAHKADVNARANNGWTPLLACALSGPVRRRRNPARQPRRY